MEGNTNRFVQVADAVYAGRRELGHSIENDEGKYDAFSANAELLGTFDSRIEARRAIIDAANNEDVS